MKQILIGGILRNIPQGYLDAESEFTEHSLMQFYDADDSEQKEEYRSIVLRKRLEFYHAFKLGKVIIPEPVLQDKSKFQAIIDRFCLWLR